MVLEPIYSVKTFPQITDSQPGEGMKVVVRGPRLAIREFLARVIVGLSLRWAWRPRNTNRWGGWHSNYNRIVSPYPALHLYFNISLKANMLPSLSRPFRARSHGLVHLTADYIDRPIVDGLQGARSWVNVPRIPRVFRHNHLNGTDPWRLYLMRHWAWGLFRNITPILHAVRAIKTANFEADLLMIAGSAVAMESYAASDRILC